jgi:hypothetical protein
MVENKSWKTKGIKLAMNRGFVPKVGKKMGTTY